MSYFKAKICTKFDFGWGSTPDPVGSLQRSLRPLAGFKGSTSNKGRGGEGTEGTEKEGKEREETIPPPFVSHFKPWT